MNGCDICGRTFDNSGKPTNTNKCAQSFGCPSTYSTPQPTMSRKPPPLKTASAAGLFFIGFVIACFIAGILAQCSAAT